MKLAVWLWITLCCPMFLGPAVSCSAQQSAGRKNKMVLELKLSKPTFILRESIKIEIAIRNAGASSVQAPAIADNRNTALRYTLTGPSFEKPFTFDYGGPDAFRIPGDPAMETIPPGGEIRKAITVQQYWKAWKPGKHTLRASMGDLQSNALSFEILAPQILSAEVLVDHSTKPPAFMRVLFLAKTAASGAPLLYQGFYPEVEPDVELTPEGNIVEAGAADAGAQQVAATWTNFDRSALFFARFGWLGKDGLIGMQEFDSQVTVQPGPGERMVRPAYMAEDGSVSLLSSSGRQVSFWRVPRKGEGDPARQWSATLPFEPSIGRFATSTGGTAGLFAAQTKSGVEFALIGGDGKTVGTAEAPDLTIPPRSDAALTLDPDGSIRFALLLADADKNLRLVEWVRRPGEIEFRRRNDAAFRVPAGVKATTAIYGPPAGNPRRDWVVLLEDGSIITNRNPARPRRVEGEVVVPLQLLPRPQMTYLLLTHPAEVVYLAPMF